MKKSIYLSLIFGAFLFVSCKETPKSQKVVLVQGSFKYDKEKSTLTTSFKGKDLIIPVDSVRSSTVLSLDTLTGTYQVSMILNDNGAFLPLCDGDNCPHLSGGFSINGILPPPCWQGGAQCRGGIFLTHLALDPSPAALNPAFQFENSANAINR